MTKAPRPYREMKQELDEIMAWFGQDNLEVDEAMQKYQEAEKLIKAIEAYLSTTSEKIDKL